MSTQVRESSSEKERDAKFPVSPDAFSPESSSRKHPDPGDAVDETTHLGEAASTPGWEAPRPAPRGARAPLLGHASFPARDRRELSPRLWRTQADGGLGRPRGESPERLIQLYPWHLARREEKAQLVLFSSRLK